MSFAGYNVKHIFLKFWQMCEKRNLDIGFIGCKWYILWAILLF